MTVESVSEKSLVTVEKVVSPSVEILNYALAAYRALFGHLVSADRVPPDLEDFQQTYLTTGRGSFFVARALPSASVAWSRRKSSGQGRIVGIIAYRPYQRRFYTRSQEDDVPHLRPELAYPGLETVEFARLFVEPAMRGYGIARALVSKAVETARCAGAEVLYLHTHPFLPGALEVWSAMGWDVVTQDVDGVWDTIHMCRTLRASSTPASRPEGRRANFGSCDAA